MAEDAIDDAIDAVVRAVDRIERATREAGVEVKSRPSGSAAPGPEFYELVGRLVTHAQQLDSHLTAASELRSEIAELVARVAAAAETP